MFNSFLGDAQRISCGLCSGVHDIDRERVDESMKLVSSNIKSYKYGDGVTLSFVTALEVLHSTCVFANSPLYNDLLQLKKGESYQVVGWKTVTHANGNCFIKLVDLPDISV